jgi:hypothetical protein
VEQVDLVVELLVVQVLRLHLVLPPLQQQTLAAAAEEEGHNHLQDQVLLAVPVSSSSVIRSVNSQSKRLVEQFHMLMVRLFTPLLHQRPLQSPILL